MSNRSMIRASTALGTGSLAAVVTGCALAKDVFRAGVWIAILALACVLVIVGTARSLMKKA